MSSKASIVNVEFIELDNVKVIYDTGTVKYFPCDKLPKTARTWISEHESEPETASETPETAFSEPEAVNPTPEPQKTHTGQNAETVNFVLIGLPYDFRYQFRMEEPETEPEPAAVLPDPEPVRTWISPGAALLLIGLSAAWIGVSACVYACEILALLALATQSITYIFGKMYQRAKTDFIRLVSWTGERVQAAARTATRAARRAYKAGKIALMVICIRMIAKARMTACKAAQIALCLKLWAVDAWAFRNELVTAENIIS